MPLPQPHSGRWCHFGENVGRRVGVVNLVDVSLSAARLLLTQVRDLRLDHVSLFSPQSIFTLAHCTPMTWFLFSTGTIAHSAHLTPLGSPRDSSVALSYFHLESSELEFHRLLHMNFMTFGALLLSSQFPFLSLFILCPCSYRISSHSPEWLFTPK